MLNDSEEILVLVDDAHRSHTRALHRNLPKALPNAAIIGFTGTPILANEKTETREIFGEFIDKYILQDADTPDAKATTANPQPIQYPRCPSLESIARSPSPALAECGHRSFERRSGAVRRSPV